MIDDEDRERRADVRTEQHASSGGVRDVRVRLEIRHPVTIDGAVCVDPRIACGVTLLADEEHVVPRRSPDLGDPRGRDVGPRALQEPSVPDEDPHVSDGRAYPAASWKAVPNAMVRAGRRERR